MNRLQNRVSSKNVIFRNLLVGKLKQRNSKYHNIARLLRRVEAKDPKALASRLYK